MSEVANFFRSATQSNPGRCAAISLWLLELTAVRESFELFSILCELSLCSSSVTFEGLSSEVFPRRTTKVDSLPWEKLWIVQANDRKALCNQSFLEKAFHGSNQSPYELDGSWKINLEFNMWKHDLNFQTKASIEFY